MGSLFRYSGTSIVWTQLVPSKGSWVKSCPYFGGFRYISGRCGNACSCCSVLWRCVPELPLLYSSMSAICCISAGKFPAHTLKIWSFLSSAGNSIPTFPFYFYSFPPFLFFSPHLSILPPLSFIFVRFFSSLYSLPPFLVAVWLTLDNFVVCSEWKVYRLL